MNRASGDSNRTIWLDLTTLIHATGTQPTGIPRTIVRIFHHWVKSGIPNLRYYAMDTERDILVEVDPDTVLARFPLEPTRSVSETVALEKSRGSWPRSVVDSLKEKVREIASNWLPHRARHELHRLIQRGRGTVRIGNWALHKVRHYSRKCLRVLKRCYFKRHTIASLPLSSKDLLITLGGGWVLHDSSELMWRLRKEQGFRLATLIYDIIPIKFPQFYGPGMPPYFRHWTTNTIWASDLLLTISQHSARDLQDFTQENLIPCPPVEVLRLGEDLPTDESLWSPPQHRALQSGTPFVLTVGTIEVRKNHILLYHVWRRLVEKLGKDVPNLVIVGSRGWLVDDLLYQITNDPLVRDKIILLTHIPDHQLNWLYRNCQFTLYPSHYEGWGLPIAESLRHGKYCIASNSSSMPEVGGELAGRHDPTDVDGTLKLVIQALDRQFLDEQETRIRCDYRPVLWGETAEELLEILNRYSSGIWQKDICDVRDQDFADRSVSHPTTYTRRTA